MTNVLILGGTGWLSGRIARAWLDRGAQVTCLARGGRPAPEGAELVRADRDDADAYAAVARQDWDRIVDISSRADHVRDAVEAIGQQAGQWTYISSMSVYSDDVTLGADESAPRYNPARPGDEYDYGAQKVAAEDAVAALGDIATIIRPGLIVGPGDPSDRFGYWAAAFARADDGPVLLPPVEGRSAQVIDVDDVAAFAVTAPAGLVANAVGDVHPLGGLLERVRTIAGHTGPTVTVAADELIANGVGFWMGDRSLPLWLPDDMPGFMMRANAASLAAGGRLSPLDETIARVLADEIARGLDRPRRAGLTRDEEVALLAGR